ncbi:MAG: hypothetical protein ACYC1K_03150 [Minisyncoccota bacterium]
MQILRLFVLMLAVVVISACGGHAPEAGFAADTMYKFSAVITEAPTPVPGVNLSYVTTREVDREEVRKVLVDNTKKFAVGDTVKIQMVQYRATSLGTMVYVWAIAK